MDTHESSDMYFLLFLNDLEIWFAKQISSSLVPYQFGTLSLGKLSF